MRGSGDKTGLDCETMGHCKFCCEFFFTTRKASSSARKSVTLEGSSPMEMLDKSTPTLASSSSKGTWLGLELLTLAVDGTGGLFTQRTLCPGPQVGSNDKNVQP